MQQDGDSFPMIIQIVEAKNAPINADDGS